MNTQQVLARIDPAAALEFLAGMVRHKSYSGTTGETELARFMAAAMRGLGMEVTLMPVEGERLNAIGRRPGTGGGKSLMFNGHLDTNPATADWTVDPWGGKFDDAFIYGIGVSNMKAGDAAAYCALKTLVEAGIRLKGDVILEYVVGELQGGVGTVEAIEQGVRADYFINAEPTDLNGLTLHAGAFNFVIELTGETRHVSKREDAVDAIVAACQLVPELDAMTFSGADGAAHHSVNRCHVGVLRGALTPEFHDWRPPQVADYARLVGTARYAPSQSEETVMADLRRVLDQLQKQFPGLIANVSKEAAGVRPTMLPFEAAHDSPIVRAVAEAYREVRGAEQPLGPIRPYCFYGTDAAHLLHLAGMPAWSAGRVGATTRCPMSASTLPTTST